jgi:hypothetical protein
MKLFAGKGILDPKEVEEDQTAVLRNQLRVAN